MSVIGLELTKTKIRLAFDAQTTTGDDKAIFVDDPKGFKVNNLLIGVTGNVITKQYLKEFLKNKKDINLDKCYDVCELMHEFLEQCKDNDRVTDKEHLGSVLISDGKKAFGIDLKYFSCYEIETHWFIGSGGNIAEGAYLMQKKNGDKNNLTVDALNDAILIACQKDLYCGEPVIILEVDRK